MKLKQATISVAGISVRAYEDEVTGERYLYRTSIAEAVEKHHTSVAEFLRSKQSEALLCNGLSVAEVECRVNGFDGIQKLSLIPPAVAKFYWGYWYRKGNKAAAALTIALMGETIERLLDIAFNGHAKFEVEYREQTAQQRDDIVTRWEDARERCRNSHAAFQLACEKYRWNAAQIHDAMTMTLFGLTAEQLRKRFELIGLRRHVGLDHLPGIEAMECVARAKHAFARYRKLDNWQERLARACREAAI